MSRAPAISRPWGLLEAVDAGLLPCKPYPRQREILGHVEHCIRSTLCIGRRAGKSRGIAAPTLVWRAALRPDLRAHAQPGERIWHVAVAANQEQARIVLGEARRLLHASPALRQLIERETDSAIYLTNGSVIAALVCNARTIRGLLIATAVLDEVAFFANSEDGPAAAQAVYRAITPGMATFGGDRRLIVSSTPNGNEGFFKTLFDQAWAAVEAGDESVFAAHLPTWEVNPAIPDEVYAQEREALGLELFDAEYGARFLGSGNALLGEADIRACVRPGGDLDPLEVTDCVLGADFGYRRDPSAAVVVGRPRYGDGGLTVCAVNEWEPAKDLSEGTWQHQQMIYREVADLARQYGNAEVWCDTHEAATVRAQLGRFGAYVHTVSMAEHKYEIHRELARHVRSALITFPEHPALISDLRRLRVVYGGQKPRVENPRGGGRHGDVGQALAQTMNAFAGQDAFDPAAAAAVAVPGRGWSDGNNAAAAGAGAGFVTPGRASDGYDSPGASGWLDGPSYLDGGEW
jgi:hypothetical protein